VRIPSAWNDLVGLKTTAGRLSLEGVVPLALKFDTVGPLCRSIEDAARMLAALEGGKPADLKGATLEGKRLAILQTIALDDVRDEPQGAFQDAVLKLGAAGAKIRHVNVPEIEDAMALTSCLYTTEAYGLWRDVIEAHPEKMYAEILQRFRLGKDHSGPDYVAAWATLEATRIAYDKATAGFDAVILPTAPILPPDLARMKSDHTYYVTENLLSLRNTRIGNLMGLCALSLPTGVPSCGLMMMMHPHHEEALLRLGAAAERALA
jgi:aspartyl-tRNA(Asn)/glutamyl-tRNA(Gln) amidotransferase subunit A